MYKPHDHVNTPFDRTVIWRYMSIASFSALLLDNALFFTRLDRAEDPWDGVFPRRSREPDEVAEFFSRGDKEIDPLYRKLARVAVEHSTNPELGRASYCISCWHMNRFESDAMWKVYSLLGQGIAIRSTVGRLKKSFSSAERPIFIGRVEYHDYEKVLINPAMVFPVVFCKRKSFQHERELRCVLYSWGWRSVAVANRTRGLYQSMPKGCAPDAGIIPDSPSPGLSQTTA